MNRGQRKGDGPREEHPEQDWGRGGGLRDVIRAHGGRRRAEPPRPDAEFKALSDSRHGTVKERRAAAQKLRAIYRRDRARANRSGRVSFFKWAHAEFKLRKKHPEIQVPGQRKLRERDPYEFTEP